MGVNLPEFILVPVSLAVFVSFVVLGLCGLLWHRQRRFEALVSDRLEQLNSKMAIRHQQYALMRAQLKSIKKSLLSEVSLDANSPAIESDFTAKMEESLSVEQDKSFSCEPGLEQVTESQGLASPEHDKNSIQDLNLYAMANKPTTVDYRQIVCLIEKGVEQSVIMQAFDVSRSEIELLCSLHGSQTEKMAKE